MSSEAELPTTAASDSAPAAAPRSGPACPACGGRLLEIRAKLQCERCHQICETCCEGSCG